MESRTSYPQLCLGGTGGEGDSGGVAHRERQTEAIFPLAYGPAGTLETFLGYCPDDLHQLLPCQLRFKHGGSPGLPLCALQA